MCDLLAKATASVTTGKFTLEKNLMSVGNMRNCLDKDPTSWNTRVHTGEKAFQVQWMWEIF